MPAAKTTGAGAGLQPGERPPPLAERLEMMVESGWGRRGLHSHPPGVALPTFPSDTRAQIIRRWPAETDRGRPRGCVRQGGSPMRKGGRRGQRGHSLRCSGAPAASARASSQLTLRDLQKVLQLVSRLRRLLRRLWRRIAGLRGVVGCCMAGRPSRPLCVRLHAAVGVAVSRVLGKVGPCAESAAHARDAALEAALQDGTSGERLSLSGSLAAPCGRPCRGRAAPCLGDHFRRKVVRRRKRAGGGCNGAGGVAP